MNRPLVISDCDEVLLHMVGPFRDWLAETQGISFSLSGHNFAQSMRRMESGEPVPTEEIWPLLDSFFVSEMGRQYPIPGAIEAMRELGERADVVVLTNLGDTHQQARTAQLRDHGLDLRVFTNQGPKGPALKRIIDEFHPSAVCFIDDIAQHHGSVAEIAPHVHRLHFCGEPQLAPHIACAHASGHAHARIDEWTAALPWLLGRLHGESE
jgi:FMN phosphatase YigB (HAD superfamily)